MTGRQLAIALLLSLGGLCQAQTAPSGLLVSPTRIDFSETALDSQASTQTITLSNPTQSRIDLAQILTAGIDFSERHDCAQALEPNTQCIIQVFFKPAITGPRNGNLVIMGSDPASPHFIALSGTGK